MSAATADQVAEAIRLAAIRPALTYREIGQRVGLHKHTVNRIARGVWRPRRPRPRPAPPPPARRLGQGIREMVSTALSDLLRDTEFHAKADRAVRRG